MKVKNILLVGVVSLCIYLFAAQVMQERRINTLESTVGNQRISLQNQEQENKSLNDQIDALNIKVDKLPK